jgi:hypothetical protein
VLVLVNNKRERSSPVRPLGVEKTSRLDLRDPVASGVKCGPHCGKSSGTKSWTVSWLSLKTKVESGLRGSRVMSDDWRRLHRVRGVYSGSPENQWVTRLSQKTRLKTRRGGAATQAGSTAQEGWSDRLGRSDRQRGGGGLTALVAAAEKLQSGGHASGSQGLRRG